MRIAGADHQVLPVHSAVDSVGCIQLPACVSIWGAKICALLLVCLYGLQEYLFRNIQRDEWDPLFSFINARKIRIDNLAEARHGPRGPGQGGRLRLGEAQDNA